jgi:FkbM family methyltransferase
MPARAKWRYASKLTQALEFDNPHWAVTRMRDGFRMTLNVAESYERIMYYSRVYAPWLAHVFKRVLQPGDTVIDGGANIGYFSLLGAKRVGPGGAVHSFEPIPATFTQLSENIKLNGYSNVAANCNALAAEAGQVEFEVPQERGTNISLGRLATVVHSGRGPRVAVTTCSLDEYVAAAHIGEIKLAKLDLEGGELTAIRGMQRILSAHQIAYLICELSLPILDQQGIPHSAQRDALAAHGYQPYFIKVYGGIRRPMQVHFIPVQHMPIPEISGDYLYVAPGHPLPRMR